MKIYINQASGAILKIENEEPIVTGNNYADKIKIYYNANPATLYFYPTITLLKPNNRKVGPIQFDTATPSYPQTYIDSDSNDWWYYEFTLSSVAGLIDITGKCQVTITTNYYSGNNITSQRNVNIQLNVFHAVTNTDNDILILGESPDDIVASMYTIVQSLQTSVGSLSNSKFDKSNIGLVQLYSSSGTLTTAQYAEVNKPYCIITLGDEVDYKDYYDTGYFYFTTQTMYAFNSSTKVIKQLKSQLKIDENTKAYTYSIVDQEWYNKTKVSDDLDTKADRNNTDQTIVAGNVKATVAFLGDLDGDYWKFIGDTLKLMNSSHYIETESGNAHICFDNDEIDISADHIIQLISNILVRGGDFEFEVDETVSSSGNNGGIIELGGGGSNTTTPVTIFKLDKANKAVIINCGDFDVVFSRASSQVTFGSMGVLNQEMFVLTNDSTSITPINFILKGNYGEFGLTNNHITFNGSNANLPANTYIGGISEGYEVVPKAWIDYYKIDKSAIYNGLDKTTEGYVLDARAGKALKDSLDTLYNYVGFATGDDSDTAINKLREVFQFLAGALDNQNIIDLLGLKADKSDFGYIELSNISGTLTDAQYAEAQKKYCLISYNNHIYYKYADNTTYINFVDFVNIITFVSYIEVKHDGFSITKENKSYVKTGKDITFYGKDKTDELLAAKQDVISSNNKLSSDLITDENKTNKFVTTGEKATWNAKQNDIDLSIVDGCLCVTFSE